MTLSNPQTGIPKFAVDLLNPQKHLDSRLTFSRAGNATMFDATGKLVWAPANMFLNSATLATQSVTVVVGQSYTMSAYGTGSVELSAGASGTWTGTGVGDRVSLAFTATTTTATFTVTGSVTSAQLEPTSYNSPQPYIATTSAAYYRPRFDYDPVTFAPRGLLIEEQRTNLNYPSSGDANSMINLGGTSCTKGSGAVGTGIAGGTPGTIAKTSIATGARGQTNRTVAASTIYTASIFLEKPPSFNGEYIAFGEVAEANGLIIMNPFTGSISNKGSHVTSAFVDDCGLWWRIKVSMSLSGTTWATAFFPAFNTDGSFAEMSAIGTGYFHTIDGIQLEQGAFATSYIPTTGSTATRAADSVSLSTPSWMDLSKGTFFVDYTIAQKDTHPSVFGNNLSNAGFNTDSFNKESWWNGTSNIQVTTSYVSGSRRKSAFAYTSSSRSICSGGGTVVSDSYAPWSGTPTTWYFGRSATSVNTQNINGWLRGFKYWNRTLTNSQLQQVTK